MKELTVVYNERHPNFDLLQKDALGTLGVGVTAISERDEISRMGCWKTCWTNTVSITAIFDFKPPCRVYPAGGISGFNF